MPTPDTGMEMVAESNVVETERTHLTDDGNTLLKELLRPGASIEAVIPEDVDPQELWRTLASCARGLNLLEARSTRVSFIIGKILTMFEHRPSLYKDLGYETWSDFMRKGVAENLGLHHSAAYEAKKTVENWPQLTPDSYAQIGPKKMGVLNKFTTGRTPSAGEWLDAAKSMKVSEFKNYVENRGLLAPGEATGATLMMTTNRDRLALFNAFFNDGRVQQVVGAKDRDRILEAMIQECYDTWIDRFEQQKREKYEAEGRVTA